MMLKSKKCVFLDRDGTIIRDYIYNCDISRIDFLPGVVESLKRLKEAGYLLIVITNQSGVARGFFSIEDVVAFHSALNEKLLHLGGIRLDSFYVCPHHKEGIVSPFNVDCNCRKPNPSLLLRAAHDYEIDLPTSFIIGDKDSDIAVAERVRLAGTYKVDETHRISDIVDEILKKEQNK